MTPKFIQAIDPVFLHVLDLLDRIDQGDSSAPQAEQLQIMGLLDQAEAIVGSGHEWELAKYALVSWVDEMLVETVWEGSDWWSNNVLEVKFFKTRNCNEQFYLRARETSTLPQRDTLEVFYVCVILGFRGLYRDPELTAGSLQVHGLPPDLDTWTKQTSLSIRLGQGRPPLARAEREMAGAPLRKTKTLLVWAWLLVIILITCNVLYFNIVATGS